eukprot:c23254_g1_i1 orf=2-166(-)
MQSDLVRKVVCLHDRKLKPGGYSQCGPALLYHYHVFKELSCMCTHQIPEVLDIFP